MTLNTAESADGIVSDAPILKPCPFCGNAETPHVISYFDCDYVDQSEGIDGYITICDASGFGMKKGCGAATGWYETSDKAAAAWNRRQTNDEIEKISDEVSRLKQAVEANKDGHRECLEENRRLRQFHKSVMGYRSGNKLMPTTNTIFMSDDWLMEQHRKVGISEEQP